MQLAIALEGNLRTFAAQAEKQLAKGATRAADRFEVIAKLALREDVRRGGLGDRAANTWQGRRYPEGHESASPAVFLYSKWPIVINAYSEGATITHHDGLWLAIPTENVPNVNKGRNRRKASPADIEVMFNQDLIFVRRGANVLAFVDAMKSKSGKVRRATGKRLAQGRGTQLILMFVMVPQVTLRKRLNWKQVANDLGLKFTDLVGSEVANALSGS